MILPVVNELTHFFNLNDIS